MVSRLLQTGRRPRGNRELESPGSSILLVPTEERYMLEAATTVLFITAGITFMVWAFAAASAWVSYMMDRK